VLRLLPRPPDTFVGRGGECERMSRSFAERRMLFLEGIEGIGKTSLAQAIADSLETKNSGKVYFITCQEGWQADSFLHEILLWLPDDLRKSFEAWEEKNPSGIKERFLYLINLLNREEAIVFVDDFHLLTSDYLAELLKILKSYLRNSRFFFVSRERPELSSFERLDLVEFTLEGLGPEEGSELLEMLLEGHGLQAVPSKSIMKEAAIRLGGHPLLIKTFAALILEGLGEPEELLKDLPDYFQGVERDLFLKIKEGLSSEEVSLLELLSVARVPLSRNLLGDAGIREKIERRFLLSRDVKGRFSVHSLIRQYIVRGMTAEEQILYHRRLAEHFHGFLDKEAVDLELAREALYHYHRAKCDKEERDLLLRVGGKMCSQGYYEEVLQFTAGLSDANPMLLIMRANVLSILGRWKEAIEILTDLEKDLKENPALADVYSSIAGAFLNMGRLKKSLEYYEKALSLFRIAENQRGVLKCQNYMTFIFGFRAQHSKALPLSDECREIAGSLEDDAALAHALRMRGIVLLSAHRYGEALEVSRECLTIAETVGSLRLGLWALINMGDSLCGLGRYEEAREYFQESLKRGEGSLDTQVTGFSRDGLARLLWEEGLLEKGLEECKRATEDFCLQGNSLGRSRVLHTMAMIVREQGDLTEARKILEQVMNVAMEEEHFSLEAKTREALAYICLERGEPAEAMKIIEKNRKLLEVADIGESRGEMYLVLAEASWRLRETRKVDEYIRLALGAAKEDVPGMREAKALYLAGKLSGDKVEAKAEKLRKAECIRETLKGRRKRLLSLYFKRLDLLMQEKYFVKTEGGEHIAQREEVDGLRGRQHEFSLFLDLPVKVAWEKEKGDVDILGKRILSTLLIFLVKHAGRGFDSEEIFKEVWGYEYDKLTSPGEVRKNISRLRSLIEPDPKACKYIKLSEGFMKQKGRYYFDNQQSFCLIEAQHE
jgi:tetratricopeptide (TPR) repeat protein